MLAILRVLGFQRRVFSNKLFDSFNQVIISGWFYRGKLTKLHLQVLNLLILDVDLLAELHCTKQVFLQSVKELRSVSVLDRLFIWICLIQ